MPAIYKNGKQYAGIPDEVVTAWEVDDTMDLEEIDQPELGNTDISNIGDGSLTGAISELNSDIEWKHAGTVTGAGSVQLPSDWKECTIIAVYGNASGLQPQAITFHAIHSAYYLGYILTTGGGTLFAQVRVNETSATFIYFGVNNADFTSTSRMSVEYR